MIRPCAGEPSMDCGVCRSMTSTLESTSASSLSSTFVRSAESTASCNAMRLFAFGLTITAACSVSGLTFLQPDTLISSAAAKAIVLNALIAFSGCGWFARSISAPPVRRHSVATILCSVCRVQQPRWQPDSYRYRDNSEPLPGAFRSDRRVAC